MASVNSNNASNMDSTTTGYHFEWKNQTVHFTSTLEAIRNDDRFIDVTMKCEGGKSIKAHRVVLSAMSSYFQETFLEHESNHPIIVLKDIDFKDLQGIIKYIYTGQVTIEKKNVESFLKVANLFKVKGLNEYFRPSNSCTSNSTSIITTTSATDNTTSSSHTSLNNSSNNGTILTECNAGFSPNHTTNGKESESNSFTTVKIGIKSQPPLLQPYTKPTTWITNTKVSKNHDSKSKFISPLNQEKSKEKDEFLARLNLKRILSSLSNYSKAIKNHSSSKSFNNNNDALISKLAVLPKKRRVYIPFNSHTVQKQIMSSSNFNNDYKNSSVSSASGTTFHDKTNNHVNKFRGFSSNLTYREKNAVAGKKLEDINIHDPRNEQDLSISTNFITPENLASPLPPLLPNPNSKSMSSNNNGNSGKMRRLNSSPLKTSSDHSIPTLKSAKRNIMDNDTDLKHGDDHDNEFHLTCIHADGRHVNGSFVCPKCKRRYVHHRSLIDHLRAHEGKTWCDICEKWFSKPANLRAHQKLKHGGINQTNPC